MGPGPAGGVSGAHAAAILGFVLETGKPGHSHSDVRRREGLAVGPTEVLVKVLVEATHLPTPRHY